MDDALWQVIEPHLPPPKPLFGRSRAVERSLLIVLSLIIQLCRKALIHPNNEMTPSLSGA